MDNMLLKQYTAIQCNFRGKVTKQLDATGKGMLQMWALQNTKGKSKTIIMEVETKEIVMVVEGRGKDSFPKVYKTKEEIAELNITMG